MAYKLNMLPLHEYLFQSSVNKSIYGLRSVPSIRKFPYLGDEHF